MTVTASRSATERAPLPLDVEAVRADARYGRRNYAMVLLLARLGLRAPEVIAIRLEDLDWRAGELLVRGKGQNHDRVPIPPDRIPPDASVEIEAKKAAGYYAPDVPTEETLRRTVGRALGET